MKDRGNKPALLLAASLLALLALIPASAQAAPYVTAESVPVTIEDQITGSSSVTIKISNAEVVCDQGLINGVIDDEPGPLLGTTSFKLTPLLNRCTTWGLDSTAVPYSSCQFGFAVENAGPPYTAAAGVACSKAGDAFVLEDPYGFCKVSIYPNAAKPHTATLLNTGSGSSRAVEVGLNLKSVKYTIVKKGGFLCPLVGEGTFENGTIKGKTMLRSKGKPVGIFMTGEKT